MSGEHRRQCIEVGLQLCCSLPCSLAVVILPELLTGPQDAHVMPKAAPAGAAVPVARVGKGRPSSSSIKGMYSSAGVLHASPESAPVMSAG